MTTTESTSAINYLVDHVSPTVLLAFTGFVTLLVRVSWEARFQADVTLALLGTASILGVVVSFAPYIVSLACALAAAVAVSLWQRARAAKRSPLGALVLGTVTIAVGILVVPAVLLVPLVAMIIFVKPAEGSSEGGALSRRKKLRSYIAVVVVTLTFFGSFLGSGMWIPAERVSTGSSARVGYILSMDEYEFRMLDKGTRRLVNIPRNATATHHTCQGGTPVSERLLRPLPDFVLHGWRGPTPTC